jgi:hypothetical protein
LLSAFALVEADLERLSMAARAENRLAPNVLERECGMGSLFLLSRLMRRPGVEDCSPVGANPEPTPTRQLDVIAQQPWPHAQNIQNELKLLMIVMMIIIIIIIIIITIR